jgi:hypothetical protein
MVQAFYPISVCKLIGRLFSTRSHGADFLPELSVHAHGASFLPELSVNAHGAGFLPNLSMHAHDAGFIPKLSVHAHGVHCKKRVTIFPSPAGMSLTKLSLAVNN